MKFLICGIGSIGQRHYRNLLELGHSLALFRSGRQDSSFVRQFTTELAESGVPPSIYHDFEQALNTYRPDAVFITNPTSLHLDLAIPAAESGCHLFIEKPLSHNLQRINELERLVKRKNLTVMIGYNLRFHPLLQKMKALYDAGEIGAPLAANIEMGENTADWHPWEDYRDMYSSHTNMGGGAVLAFSHDIDYLYWFLGVPLEIHAIGGTLTPLEVKAEDMVKAIFRMPEDCIASLHLDYWQRPHRRVFELIGTDGKLRWDYYDKTLTQWNHSITEAPKVYSESVDFERNDMFKCEIEHFIEAIERNSNPLITLDEGIDVMRICDEIKRKLGFVCN